MVGEKGVRLRRYDDLLEWDIEFDVHVDIIGRVFDYMMGINADIPIKFFKNKMLIHQKSSDGISYSEIELEISDQMNYKPGLPENAADTDYKMVVIDITGLSDEIMTHSKGESIIVNFKADTKVYKKVEISVGEYKTWTALLVPSDLINKLDNVAKSIARTRNNETIKKVDFILEPETFSKICYLGGKKKDIEIALEATQKGVTVYTSDKISGRSFTIHNDEYGTVHNTGTDYANAIYNAGDGDEKEAEEEVEQDVEEDVPFVKDEDIGIDQEQENDENGDDEGEADPWLHTTAQPDKVAKKKDNEVEESIKKEEEKKKSVSKAVSKFLGFSMGGYEKIDFHLKKEYICILTKLKSSAPVAFEVRYNIPIILVQRDSGIMKVLLTVAPIIEDDTD